METKYFVMRAFRYKESGAWEYKLIQMCDTPNEAKQVYHSNMGSIIKPSNDICMCVIFDSYSNRIDGDFDSTYVEPEPEPEEEEE